MHPILVAVPALLLAFAGCLEASDDGGGPGADGDVNDPPAVEWHVGGTFTQNATQNDTAELGAQIEALGGQLLVMESFPMQYQANGLTSQSCQQARGLLEAKDYVASVDECRSSTGAGDEEEPVSNEPDASGGWALRGTLAREATQDDTADLQAEVESRGGQLFLLESLPLQFHASGLAESACGDLRNVLAAKEYVTDMDACARTEPAGDDGDAPVG